MSKKLALRAAKLSSESQKLKNSSNVSTAYEHHPKDPDERRHGILFGVIDVNGSSKHSEDLIELIIDTFHSEYFQDLDREPLESFENALAKINEELGEYTNNGNTYWMGKLNAILAVFADDTIHITQAGKSEAYLYRAGKESHITEDLRGDSVNPLRTFVNITSGELAEGDKISILSSGIRTSCSPKEVADYVTKYHSKVAIGHIADLIEGVGGSHGQNAAIVIEFMSPDALANEVLDEEPDEIWLQGTTKKEVLAEQTTNILGKIFKYLHVAGLVIMEFIRDRFIPKAKSLLSFLAGKTGDIHKKYTSKKDKSSGVLMDTEEEIEGFETEEVPVLEETPETFEEDEKIKKPEYKSEIRIKESEESPNKARLVKTKSSIINNLGAFYGSATKLANIKKTKKKVPKLKKNHYLAIGVLILLVFVPYLFITKIGQTDAKTKKQEKAKIEEIDAKLNEATRLTNQNEKQKAVEILTAAKKIAEDLKKSKFYGKEASDKTAAIDSQINTITLTKDISPEVLADIASFQKSEAVGAYSVGNVLYVIGKSGDIARVEKKSKKVTAVQVSGSLEGEVIAATALAKIKTIAILTNKPALYEFDTDDDSLTEKKATDGWEKAVDLDSYGTSLYLLSQEGPQIYKHTRTASGYQKKAEYLASGEELKNPLSFRIDSDIYVLVTGGEIQKFTSGKKQDFQIKDIPISLGSADIIYTDTETDNLVIASKSDKYIIVVGKDGSYLGRYVSNQFDTLKNVLIEGNTIYVVTNNKVLTFELK